MSPLTRLYLAFSQVSGPIWRVVMSLRLKKGKELPARVGEKTGIGVPERPEGRVMWCHALGVGESLALVPLIEKALAADAGLSVVITTSTATSVPALANAGLPERAVHVLSPIDTVHATRDFLERWRPSVAVFAELDFWPRLMIETRRRGVPMVLINARLSERNLKSRSRLGGMMRDILGLFDAILLQDEPSVARIVSLGAPPGRIEVVGALKAAARPLPADEEAVAALRASVGDRPVWLAAATERSEHPAVVEAAARVAEARPDALMVVAPRHVADGPALASDLVAAGFAVGMRSKGDGIGRDTTAYVADTIGEMGLWYRLAPVSFVGHSLPQGDVALGGKNPYEAAALGSAILYGPATADFAETYEGLAAARAAREVRNAGELAEAVLDLFDEGARRPLVEAARQVVTERRAVLDRTWDVIDRLRLR